MADSVLHGNKIEGIRIKDVKIMAKKFLYAALAGVGMLLAGCSEDVITNDTQAVEKHVGDEIMFGGSASYDTNRPTKATRTEYGGYENIANGAEPVYWTQGDDVRVYCPEARFQMSDYDVNVTGSKVITTSLSRRGDHSLQWGESLNHTFYAVYPAPTTNVEGSDLNGSTSFTGKIPTEQKAAKYTAPTEGGYSHVFTPDMNYAYMVAKTYVPDRNKIGTNVYLQFRPIATAVEVTLQNNTGRNLTFQQIQCYSEAGNIAGTFTAELGGMTEYTSGTMQYATGYPAITVGEGEDAIIIPMQDNAGQDIVVKLGQSVTFTVFMLPNADVNDLQISLKAKLGDTEGYKTGTLNGVTIQKHKKTYLRNLSLSGVSYTQSEWVKALVENTQTSGTVLRALSIPGAGGATSGNMDNNSETDKYRQQNLDIEGLWNKGIRCFEFAVDVAGTTVTGNTSLGNEIVLCNGQKTGISLQTAVNSVTALLKKHPKEFAMVIIAYQTLGGFSSRTPSTFMTQFNSFWSGITSTDDAKGYKTAAFSPTMTVTDAQKTLFCMVRPTSIYQDYDDGVGEGIITADVNSAWWAGLTNTENHLTVESRTYSDLKMPNAATDVIVVKGWGALKDKWQQRGYTKHSIRQNNVPSHWFFGTIYYEYDDMPGRPFDSGEFRTSNDGWDYASHSWHGKTWYGNFPNGSYEATVTPNFTYATTTDGLDVYAQEWARVSDMTYPADTDTNKDAYPQVDVNSDGTVCSAIAWNNTYEEKRSNVTGTLTKALENTGNTIYINSLCGYFVDNNIPESYKPCTLTDWSIYWNATKWYRKPLPGASQTSGMYGNIEGFAKTINDDFNKHLQSVTETVSKLGSMGIIMLDRVGEYESSERIPQIIIANNFQFALNPNPNLDLTKGGNVKQEDVVLSREQNRGTKSAAPIITWE